MIVITLAGESSRFFNSGFLEVKYKLMLGSTSVIESILNYIPRYEKLLLILNKKFDDFEYFNQILKKMNFINFKVVEIANTNGQFESLVFGLQLSMDFWNELDSICIYNGDTVRKSFDWSFQNCDGFIEVFESDGIHWSFVDRIGNVRLVTEKNRISSFCSSGLYYFKHIKYIFEFKDEFIFKNKSSELYIAPFYNLLISNKLKVKSGLIDKNNFLFCGTPDEYNNSIKLI